MATVDLTFINASDNAELDAELDLNLRTDDVIRALVGEKFIPQLTDPTRSYQLEIKGRNTIAEGQTLAAAGVQAHDRIRVSLAQRGGQR